MAFEESSPTILLPTKQGFPVPKEPGTTPKHIPSPESVKRAKPGVLLRNRANPAGSSIFAVDDFDEPLTREIKNLGRGSIQIPTGFP